MSELVVVNDMMQHDYRYLLTAPYGDEFDASFSPELTPAMMLELGVFGGIYLRDCINEFPAEWFTTAKFATGTTPDSTLNCFKIIASQPLSIWQQKGWIHPDDPRGWFQWYCRYYCGRRHEDDRRQIRRWRAIRRHVAQLQKHCPPRDFTCRPKQRQALLQWAYDSREY